MFKSKQKLLNISLFLAALMLLSACGGNMIKPIQKGVIGHSTVRNISVVTIPQISSKTITKKLKASIDKEAKKELKGKLKVDLKVTIDKWNSTENQLGGGVASRFLGSKTELGGTVKVLDIKSGAVIGEYTIFQQRKVGGLLDKSITFFDVDTAVINDFATYTINELE